jgi:hypothetical protein
MKGKSLMISRGRTAQNLHCATIPAAPAGLQAKNTALKRTERALKNFAYIVPNQSKKSSLLPTSSNMPGEQKTR